MKLVKIKETTRAAMHDLYYSLNDEQYLALVQQMVMRAKDKERLAYVLSALRACMAMRAIRENRDVVDTIEIPHKGKMYKVTTNIRVEVTEI